jgi:tetratricopeptide (TPR) repeat protein
VIHNIHITLYRVFAQGVLAAALTRVGDDQAGAAVEEAVTAALASGEPGGSQALSDLARALAAAEDDRADVVFDEAWRMAQAVRETEGRTWALQHLTQALAAVQRYEQAFRTVRTIAEENQGWALEELIGALISAQRYEEAQKLAVNIRDEWGRLRVRERLIAALAQAKRYDEALEIARSIENEHSRKEALRTIAADLARNGDHRAGAILEEVRSLEHTDYSAFVGGRALQKILSITIRSGDKQKATSIIETALTHVRNVRDPRAKAQMLEGLAAGFSAVGDSRSRLLIAEARKALSSLKDNKARIQELGYLSVRAAHNQDAQCLAILSDAVNGTHTLENEDRVSVLCRLSTLAPTSFQDTATSRVSQLIVRTTSWLPSFVRPMRLTLALWGYRMRRLIDEAETVAAAIQEGRVKAAALRELAEALARLGRFEQSKETALSIQQDEALANALRTLAISLAFAGRIDQTIEVTDLIQDGRARSHAMGVLAQALARLGRYDEAKGVASAISDQFSRADALVGIAYALAKTRDGQFNAAVQEATTALAAVEEGWAKPDVSKHLADALARAGRFVDALAALGPRPLDDLLATLAEWLSDSSAAMALLREGTDVAGWVYPDWRQLHGLLSETDSG